MTPDLTTALGPLTLKNPVLTASGTFAYGEEFSDSFDLTRLGGIGVKGLTLEPREGNDGPRCVETASGMLNSIGLANIGIDKFLSDVLPRLRRIDTHLLVNISGHSLEECEALAQRVAGQEGISLVELNVSCPNVKSGGMAFGVDPALTREVTSTVRNALGNKPLAVKLSPNVTDIVPIAKAAMDAGADILTVANTHLGMAINPDTRRPVMPNVTGGLSGPAIKPITLRLVYQVHRALPEVPIIGVGGIMSGRDAVEYLLAGASAVAVGMASLVDPRAALNVLKGLERHCTQHGIARVRDLIGALES